jgi:tRNA pseudouridine55 synthase
MINGIVNIYKEAGYTSHDVVAKLRGILHQKKIGHTGTLDPDATGVLPVCLGRATKVCELLTDMDKTYHATMILGFATDTGDISGKVIERDTDENLDKIKLLDENEIRKVISGFVGDYAQIPPMYSALKVNGKKLYELAREGKTVERKSRTVKISDIEIVAIRVREDFDEKEKFVKKKEVVKDEKKDFGIKETLDEEKNYIAEKWIIKKEPNMDSELGNEDKIDLDIYPTIEFEVTSSKGTYIRTLCEDIAKKLGTLGCMKTLVRTRVGRFEIKDSIRIDEVSEQLDSKLYSLEDIFTHLPEVTVVGETEKSLYNGNVLYKNQVSDFIQGEVRVYDSRHQFVAIYKWLEDKDYYKIVKMFYVQA